MATIATEYNLKGKCSSSTRSSAWGGFARSEMRSIVAFQVGAVAAFVFMIVIFMPINYLWSSSDDSSISPWTLFLRREQFSKEWNAQGINTLYVREWEFPEVRAAQADDIVSETAYGEVPRRFIPFGTANFLFSLFSAYRTGPQTFVVLGLGPRAMHKHWSKPGFECYWDSGNDTSSESLVHSSNTRLPLGDKVIQGIAKNHYPKDLGFSSTAEYTTVLVHCTFESPVGLDGKGGELKMIADHGEVRQQSPLGSQNVEFVAMTEARGAYSATAFEAPFQYEYMYCGGPLYGSVNPHRLREWVAYHMRLFGENAHFIFYDNGGINDESWRVLEPWVKLKRLTIMNVRQEARYDAYYHSQFLLSNDCLCRAKTLARWAFFFDVDEYLHVTVSPHLEMSFHKVMSEVAERGRKATFLQFKQRAMSHALCAKNESAPSLHQREWAMEKLIYQRHRKDEEMWPGSGVWTGLDDFKSAIQPKYVSVMGVHEPGEVELPEGVASVYYTCAQPNALLKDKSCSSNSTGDKLVYYHYHGITSMKDDELCQEYVVSEMIDEVVEHDGATFKFDNSLSLLVDNVKEYELKAIGTLQ